MATSTATRMQQVKGTTAPSQILLDSIYFLDRVSTMCPREVIWGCFSIAGRQWPGQFCLPFKAHYLDNARAQSVHNSCTVLVNQAILRRDCLMSNHIKLCQVEDEVLSLYSCSQGNTGRSLQLPGFRDTSVIWLDTQILQEQRLLKKEMLNVSTRTLTTHPAQAAPNIIRQVHLPCDK